MASSNRKSGGAWKDTRHDKFYHLAKEQGYRSRAAFKLIQLNKKYDFLSNCKSIVDLGAAPGGWLQVAQKYMPVSSLIIGVDLLPIRPIRGVTTIQADITTEQCKKQIKQELQTWDVDVVVHDGAPNVAGGGSWTKDAYVQNELVIHSLRLATTVLRPGGWFVTKVFRSQDYNSLLWVLQQFFKKVEVTKPQASRNASAEIFIVCQGYLAPKKIDAKLLDPNEIFQSFDESTKKKPDVFSRKEGAKAHRSRQGYADVDNMTQTTVLSVVDFVSKQLDTTEAIAALGDNTSFVFEKSASPDPAVKQAHDAVLAVIASHASTTDEVRALCADLKVLGKGDFKALLKWRKRVQDHLALLEEEEKKADGRWDAEQEAKRLREAERAAQLEAEKPALSAEEQFALELRELRAKKMLDAKKDKKKKREAKAKQSKRQLLNAHNLKESSELIGGEAAGANTSSSAASLAGGAAGAAAGGEEGLFSLRTIKSRDALDYVAETEGKGKLPKSASAPSAAAGAGADDDSDGGLDDEEDDDEDGEMASSEEEDEEESALYARVLAEQDASYDETQGRGARKGGVPRNVYEDQEENLLAKIRARDLATGGKAGASLSTETGDISLGNVRGADTDADYYAKLEKDLDYMYETYKERRDIKSKNRIGGSELLMAEEEEGNQLLAQARKEEKSKLKAQAASRKRKRDAGDSDTDESDDDMDRFNSDDAEDSEESDEDGEESAAAAGRLGATTGDESSDDDEGDNPLLRKLHREEAPSNSQRMNRWFQRGLLADAQMDDAALEEAAQGQDADDDEEAAPAQNARGKKLAAKQAQQRKRNLVEIGGADAGSSSEEEDASVRGNSDVSDDDAEDSGAATTYFAGGKAVRTKSGLKPNSVLGLDGLKRSTASVAADVIMDDAADAKKDAKGKKGKKERAPKRPAPKQYDDDGDEVDALKVAEQKARASLKKTTKNYKAQEKERNDAEKEKSEAFEVVPVAPEDEALEHLSSDDDAIAERLALGRHMLAKKSRNALINDSYNRYSLDRAELAGLPEWFVRDEAQHHTPILPVSKAEVDTYKEQLRAINARPIKKIAEAKARKQVKTQKRWEKIKSQAEVIANQEGGNSGDKLRQIEKLFHQKSLKKEKKERVYVVTQKNGKTVTPKSSSGRKGRIVKVDTRMKKDKRGEKKAAQRAAKTKSNKNKKQRKV